MKKIFAIALALVMVLSMASAFASACVTGPFSWDCATTTNKCGKATIEVLPLVKTNEACADWAMVESSCAAAVTTDKAYFALKLTIDKDVDPEWYAKATLAVTLNGVAAGTGVDANGKWAGSAVKLTDIVAASALTGDDSNDGWVYYLGIDSKTAFSVSAEQTEATDKAELKDVYNEFVVGNASKAKVCATLKSENKFTGATVGDYYVNYVAADKALAVTHKDGDKVVFWMDSKDKIEKITVESVKAGGTEYGAIQDALAFLNLGCGYGVCVTEDAVKANFGWKDKQESCFSWSDKAPSIVDAECVVAIPKTGDASVLAWLF